MSNEKVLESIGESHGFIHKMFWVAASLESSDFKEFLEDLDNNDINVLFPEIGILDNTDLEEDGMVEDDENNGAMLFDYLNDYKLFGFIAEVYVPVISDVRFKNDIPSSWSSSNGHCIIKYIYAETVDQLVELAIKVSEKEFEKMCLEAKSK